MKGMHMNVYKLFGKQFASLCITTLQRINEHSEKVVGIYETASEIW